jgi:uncharacterized membrane protein
LCIKCYAYKMKIYYTKASKHSHVRNNTLDIVRTIAITLMVIFHFIYDLKLFSYIDWDTPDGFGWRQFRWVIISLFFLCLGISLTFAHKNRVQGKKFLIRFAQIFSAAILISVATYLAIPQNWIFFGVLHFLAFASCVAIWFVNMPKISFAIGISIILIGAVQLLPSRWPFYVFFDNLPHYTNDYVAIFPWLGLVFIGVTIAHTKWFLEDPLCRKNADPHIWLIWPGQHSLSIYLLHQPFMVGALYLISLL